MSFDLAAVRLPSRDDSDSLAPNGEGQAVHPPFDLPEQAISLFTVFPSVIQRDQAMGVEEHVQRISEIESSPLETGVALCSIPLELDVGW